MDPRLAAIIIPLTFRLFSLFGGLSAGGGAEMGGRLQLISRGLRSQPPEKALPMSGLIGSYSLLDEGEVHPQGDGLPKLRFRHEVGKGSRREA